MTMTRLNEVVLTKKEIEEGVEKIQYALLQIGLRCNPGDIGYETVYTDDSNTTQGGWYAEFDKKSREKLRESKQVSWRNTGMVGGDTLTEILAVIDDLKYRNHTKAPSQLQLKVSNNIQARMKATSAALLEYNSAQPLTDDNLRLCLTHFRELDRLVKTDPMLSLAKPYVAMNLQVLEGYQQARKRK